MTKVKINREALAQAAKDTRSCRRYEYWMQINYDKSNGDVWCDGCLLNDFERYRDADIITVGRVDTYTSAAEIEELIKYKLDYIPFCDLDI